MIIKKYSEDLQKYIDLVHESCEGRYSLSGYDLHVIEAGLQQLQDILNEKTVSEANLKNSCSKCGKPLTLVRPGKYQCDYCVT